MYIHLQIFKKRKKKVLHIWNSNENTARVWWRVREKEWRGGQDKDWKEKRGRYTQFNWNRIIRILAWHWGKQINSLKLMKTLYIKVGCNILFPYESNPIWGFWTYGFRMSVIWSWMMESWENGLIEIFGFGLESKSNFVHGQRL